MRFYSVLSKMYSRRSVARHACDTTKVGDVRIDVDVRRRFEVLDPVRAYACGREKKQ